VTERFVPLVNDQRAALLGLLTDIPAEDWSRPTPVRGWPVHDAVAHLVEGELLFGRVYRGELTAVTREDADPQAGVERWTQADPETLRFSLWHHGSAAQRVIDSRSDGSWRREVSWFGRSVPLGHVLRFHFFDLAIHSHDVTTGLDAPSLWGDRIPQIVAFCLDEAPDALTRGGVKVEKGVHVEIDGIGSWSLEHPDGTWRVGEPREGAAVRWETDAETLVRVTTGRMPVDAALGAPSCIWGDYDVLRDVVAAWQVKAG
jgi:uncharacterized protein (TIGR03083 family)